MSRARPPFLQTKRCRQTARSTRKTTCPDLGCAPGELRTSSAHSLRIAIVAQASVVDISANQLFGGDADLRFARHSLDACARVVA